jgi:small subunit ribosomal protein S8e
MQFQGRSKRKRTGGRLSFFRKKRKSELGRLPSNTNIGKTRRQVFNSRSKAKKIRALSTDKVTVSDGEKSITATIENVVSNAANLNYVRRNVITKGAIIDTSEGRARVTSRPGQTGQVNAVLVGKDEV